MSDKVVKYTVVSRKLFITWISTNIVIFALILASFQYTNYVDRKSNSLLCGIITMYDDSSRKNPPTSSLGEAIATEFHKLRIGYHCS